VPDCPACGVATAESAAACPNCGLASGLFGPVRAAIGGPGEAPTDPAILREILGLVGGDPERASPAPVLGQLAHPARFPSTRPVLKLRIASAPISGLPELPALEGGEPRQVLRHQIDELVHLGRRLGLDMHAIDPRIRDAIAADDLAGFEAIRRELFVQVAASLAENLEIALARRNELRSLFSTGTPDADLESARIFLAHGDLPGADRGLRVAQDALTSLEEQWGTVQVLSVQADLLVETIRELGADAEPALGLLSTARARAKLGDRASAEPLFARSLIALWYLASPALLEQVRVIARRVNELERLGANAVSAREALRSVASELKVRNFGATVLAYRRARDTVPA
jgi:hypothetical protein